MPNAVKTATGEARAVSDTAGKKVEGLSLGADAMFRQLCPKLVL